MQTFIGMLNFYNRFLPNIASTIKPLYESLKGEKQIKWTTEGQVHLEQQNIYYPKEPYYIIHK